MSTSDYVSVATTKEHCKLLVCIYGWGVFNIVYNEHAQLNAVNACRVKKGGAQGVEHITQ